MPLKVVRQKVDRACTLTKRLLVLLCVWGLVFSVATISRLAVAFDYDDTLVSSEAAFHKALGRFPQDFSPQFWSVVNKSYDLDNPKLLPWTLAWAFRVCGFRVTVVTSRPAVDADGLKKDWRRLVARGRFIFVPDKNSKHQVLQSGNYVLFFGDSDSDVSEARAAHVLPVRVRRGSKSIFKEDYNPGSMGEFVLPLSQY